MKPPLKTFLLFLPAFGLIVSSINAEILQKEGILVPHLGPDVCDQGATHVLSNPCTGAGTQVWTLIFVFDCQHVYVEGLDVGVSPPYCSMIAPTTIEPIPPACLVQVQDLTVQPVAGGHRVRWSWFPCADSYDVIRGTVASLSSEDLGTVICLENDRPETFADDLTGDEPLQGEAFFYLVRPNGPIAFEHYGHASSGPTRTPATGDCPTD